MFTQPYCPTAKTKKALAATNASATTKLVDGNGPVQVRVRAPSSNTADVFFAFGDANVAADATKDDGISPGGTEVFTAHPIGGVLYAAVVTASGTATLEMSIGQGA